jgi:hypothetical protein
MSIEIAFNPILTPAGTHAYAAPVDLSQPAERARLTSAAVKGFMRLMEAWHVPQSKARDLLGGVSNGRFADLKRKVESGHADEIVPLKQDELQRISYLIGIAKSLRITHSPEFADRWMMAENTNSLMRGRAPIDYAIKEGIPGLKKIRQLVDARRGFLA